MKPKLFRTALAVGVWALASWPLSAQYSPFQPKWELPVVIEGGPFSPSSKTVSFSIKNESHKPIVAWSLAVVTIYADDEKIHQHLRTDRFKTAYFQKATDDAVAETEGALWPGQTFELEIPFVTIPAKRTPIERVAVVGNAVLFDDGDAVGDPKQVQQILDFREGYYRGFEFWLPRLESAVAHETDPLRAMRAFQESLWHAQFDESGLNAHHKRGLLNARTEMERNVASVIGQTRNAPPEAKSEALLLLQEVTLRAHAAAEHYRPKRLQEGGDAR